MTKLQEKSKSRVAKDEKFKEITKELSEAQKNKGVVRLADFRKKAKEEKTKEDKLKTKSTADRRKEVMEPYINEGVNVLGDLVTELGRG